MVVRNSMQTRYFLEMFFYFALMCIFQFQLTQFIDAFNIVNINAQEVNEIIEKLGLQLERGKID